MSLHKERERRQYGERWRDERKKKKILSGIIDLKRSGPDWFCHAAVSSDMGVNQDLFSLPSLHYSLCAPCSPFHFLSFSALPFPHYILISISLLLLPTSSSVLLYFSLPLPFPPLFPLLSVPLVLLSFLYLHSL